MILEFLTPILVGFLGSLHCIGMCGPLVAAYSLAQRGPRVPATEPAPGSPSLSAGGLSSAIPHLGRLTSYGLLGGLGAALFREATLSDVLSLSHNALMIGTGSLLALFGLLLFQWVPLPGFLSSAAVSGTAALGGFAARLLRSRKPTDRFLLGLTWGLLPCCLSWAMVVTAAASRNALHGALIMVLFGIGTLPALTSAGIFASLLSAQTRILGERLAGVFILATGVVTLLRGLGILV